MYYLHFVRVFLHLLEEEVIIDGSNSNNIFLLEDRKRRVIS